MVDATRPNTFKRNVKWQLVGSASQALLSGLMLLIVGRELQATGFGEFSIVMGFVYVANLLWEPRMQDIAAKQFWELGLDTPAAHAHRRQLIDLLLVEVTGKLLPCLALILLSTLLATTGNLPAEASGFIVVAAVGVYLSKLGNGLSVGLLRVLGRSDLFAYCATGELLLRLALTLAWIQFFPLTVLSSIVILSLSGFASNAVQWWLTAAQLDSLRAAWADWKAAGLFGRLREIRRLLLSNLGLSAADLMNKDLDITLISPLMPAYQVGIYKMAKNIVLLTWRAVDPFYLALMPEVNRLVSTANFSALKRLILKSAAGLLGLAVVLSGVSYGLVLAFGESVLGAAFAQVPGLMPLMLLGIVLSAPLVWGHPVSVALNRADVAFVGSLVGSAVGLAMFLALTPRFGTRGAGAAWALTFMVNFAYTATMARLLLARRIRASQ